MSNNLESEIQRLARVISRAERENPRVAGNAVVNAFQDNLRVHHGLRGAGGVAPFLQRRFTTKRQQGKNILVVSGKMLRSIRLISYNSTQAVVGIDDRTVAVYAGLHQTGGFITVTRAMQKFFWVQYYKHAPPARARGRASRGRGAAPNLSPEALFWRAMALKPVGAKIKVPKREFMAINPYIETLAEDSMVAHTARLLQQAGF